MTLKASGAVRLKMREYTRGWRVDHPNYEKMRKILKDLKEEVEPKLDTHLSTIFAGENPEEDIL